MVYVYVCLKVLLLCVYLEGDGCVWIMCNQVFFDLMFYIVMGLCLVVSDGGDVVYLVWFCQFMLMVCNLICQLEYWVGLCYFLLVVSVMDEVLSCYVVWLQLVWLELVGFLGGGVIVVLLVVWCKDVSVICMVVGNFDYVVVN